ncbi:transcriptional regulator family: Fungal Specific TF [Penicillium hispanicum]|uniref:transcriptional regulator family: Fungal Specific TF n=1 Tax=Penicillium hispanicum TaxID=1080232 RepID=UPI0025407605|nr:transcriptional regulator family: Fungal Specific TF [Penicillium hispanicum]KAJ5586749.1 transcriptional regulator family: Fungal Specific TF [Penicillium hispanicum]
MEIRSVGAPVTAESSESPESQTPSSAPPRKRVRRWHHRGFTGCSTCRRRHVRCDEASPACKNCTRLGLECDGTQGRMTFKVYGPTQTQEPAKVPKRRPKTTKPDSTESLPGTGTIVFKQADQEDDACEAVVVSPAALVQSPTRFKFQDPITSSNSVPQPMQYVEDRYFTHFIDQVSTLLLIYDNSTNANPYRSYFPDFARSSPSMVGAMQALGALHLANTSVGPHRNRHFQQAMGKYGEVVQLFRSRYAQQSQQLGMTDFATCLLLCLFEVGTSLAPVSRGNALTNSQMMDSQHQNWAVHLQGAREIYNLLFYPHTGKSSTREVQRVAESNHPLRSFLVSLLSYLDVAGACATPGGTVVEGNYWRTLGGGWEYNLGTPSLSSSSTPDDPRLVELRQAWSGMMEVQAAISTFARDKQWMSPDHQDMVYKEIFNRLVVWRASTPISLQLLGDMELDDESLRQFPFPDVLEYVGCIEAYEKATFVHLHQVAGAGRPHWISDRTYLDMLITRILTLIRKLSKDVGQLAVLWPLFIAGQETRKEEEQQYVRQTMQELQRFGFKNVDKALELLEGVWFKRRAFPEGWTETLDEIQSNILLP